MAPAPGATGAMVTVRLGVVGAGVALVTGVSVAAMMVGVGVMDAGAVVEIGVPVATMTVGLGVMKAGAVVGTGVPVAAMTVGLGVMESGAVVVTGVTGVGVETGLVVMDTMDTGEGDGSVPSLSQPHDMDSVASVAIGISYVPSPSTSPDTRDIVIAGKGSSLVKINGFSHTCS